MPSFFFFLSFCEISDSTPGFCECCYNKCMKQKQVSFYNSVIPPPSPCQSFTSMQLAAAFLPKLCAYSIWTNQSWNNPSELKLKTLFFFCVLEMYNLLIDDSGAWLFVSKCIVGLFCQIPNRWTTGSMRNASWGSSSNVRHHCLIQDNRKPLCSCPRAHCCPRVKKWDNNFVC